MHTSQYHYIIITKPTYTHVAGHIHCTYHVNVVFYAKGQKAIVVALEVFGDNWIVF